MIPARTRSLLSYLRMNVDQDIESLREARRSAREISTAFSEAEQLLLECALSSQTRLRQFDAVLSTRQGCSRARPSC
jgi:hypothetical protein